MNPDIKTMLECAIKAPSGHNTQPWKFRVMDHTIEILPDYSRRLPVVDADDHALFISLGCALENLLIAAHQFDWETKVHFHLEHQGEERIVISLEKGIPNSKNGLFENIPIRQSTRNEYNGQAIPQEEWEKIKKVAPRRM